MKKETKKAKLPIGKNYEKLMKADVKQDKKIVSLLKGKKKAGKK